MYIINLMHILIVFITDVGRIAYIITGGIVGLIILVLATILLVKKYNCCHRASASNNEQEMAPLRSTGRRPLPLAQFRERNNPCRPTEDEFEKMETDARNRNISKSNTTAMEFVNTNIPINRYISLIALDGNSLRLITLYFI